jgi:N-hydroxyarylamine O-acetyltransferase
MREQAGDAPMGNHLCLLVRLERVYVVDVGFGGSLATPLPLAACERVDAPYHLSLTEVDSGYWRFTERAHSAPFSFDFRAEPGDEALLAARCAFLQTDPQSPFVQNLVVQRRAGDTHLSLRGRVLTRTDTTAPTKTLLSSSDELVRVLRNTFDLDVPKAATLWPAICERHAALFGV